MPSNVVIFLTLVAGFLFIGIFDLTRYLARGWNGPRLIFGAGAFGMVLLLAAHALDQAAWTWYVTYAVPLVDFVGRSASPAESIPRSVPLAVCLGVVIPALLTLVTPNAWLAAVARRYDTNDELRLFIDREFRYVMKLVKQEAAANRRAAIARARAWKAHSSKKTAARTRAKAERDRARRFTDRLDARLIMLSMQDEKVYVGFILVPPPPMREAKYLKFLPILSGYRHKDSKTVTFTTNYAGLVERVDDPTYPLEAADLQLVLPMESILSARVFYQSAYQDHFGGAIPTREHNQTEAQAVDSGGHQSVGTP